MSNLSPSTLDIFEEMKKEIQWLHVRWIFYRQLFESSPRRIDLLNESASLFFWLVEGLLIDEIQLCLCKLTDPATMGGKDNLSFNRLQIAVESDDANFASGLKKTLDSILDKCEGSRTHRNKRISHLDLKTALRTAIKPLPPVTVQIIEDAINLMSNYMNTIEQHYYDRDTGYKDILMSGSDGESLVSLLKYSMRYEELLKEKKISFDDLDEGEWKDA